MNKSIELPQQTIKALQDGASMIIVPISNEIELTINPIDKEYGDCLRYTYKSDGHTSIRSYNEFYEEWSSLQVGDKNVFVKEEFDQKEMMPYSAYKADFEPTGTILDDIPWRPASQMTKEQSRFSIDVEDVRVVRVQDLTFDETVSIGVPENYCSEYTNRTGVLTNVWNWLNDYFNNLMQEYEDKHFTETGERISLGFYEDNPYVFLYDTKVTIK
jgi:hypothetical protein